MLITADSFSRYGPIGAHVGNTTVSLLPALLTNFDSYLGAYNGVVATLLNVGVISGLSGIGKGLQFYGLNGGGNTTQYLYKNLPSNYSRLIGGVRISSSLIGNGGISFTDNNVEQCFLQVTYATGTIQLLRGSGGVVIATSSYTLTANKVYYLEWDLTFSTSGVYNVWITDPSTYITTPVLSSSGNLRNGSANSYANGYRLQCNNPNNTFTNFIHVAFDDFYLMDTTTSSNNAVMLTNPMVSGDAAVGDSSITFPNNSNILGQQTSVATTIQTGGSPWAITGGTDAPGANKLFLRKYTPSSNCVINSVSCVPMATSAGANLKAVIYSDTSGIPSLLLSSGTQVTGTTISTTLTGLLTSPQTLVAGTAYWIGFITDTSVILGENDTGTTGVVASNTYTSDAPGTAPGMTSGRPNWILWGNCTNSDANWVSVSNIPAAGDLSNLSSALPNQEDQYTFAPLPVTPLTVAGVAVSLIGKTSNTNPRTMDVRIVSSGTEVAGAFSGLSLPTSYGTKTSTYAVDPATGIAWTQGGLNSMTAGMKIVS